MTVLSIKKTFNESIKGIQMAPKITPGTLLSTQTAFTVLFH